MDAEQVRPNMVLTQENPHQILFEFQAAKWGVLTLFLAGVVGVAAYFVVTKTDVGRVGGVIGTALSGLLLFSSVQSFMSKRSLTINLNARSVTYIDYTLFKQLRWTKSFDEFKEVVLSRVRVHLASAQPGHTAINWTVGLSPFEDLNIGEHELGMWEKPAREFATRIATKMGLPVVERGTT